jgi:hypothetical protein
VSRRNLQRGFATADHARLIAPGTNAINAGCESCHGPCSLHSDSGGETLAALQLHFRDAPQTSSYGARLAVAPAAPPRPCAINATPTCAASFPCPATIRCRREK